ncbi:MAG: T9SS type A sorting domain-containing protein [Cytophagales bacterium]|nr:T9SS type A sorting domain-containing protein [Cytophagales bacterium]MDW8384611.1 T9SS type A sorting domain-containing protein [Flammeovirgaceae bacterium]
MKYLSKIGFFVLIIRIAFSQTIAVGSWQAHLTYMNVRQVLLTPERVYAIAENGIFFVEKKQNTFQTLSTVDGLSDTEASAIQYYASRRTLIVGYTNGNIDLVTPQQIFNIRTLFNNRNFEQKAINHINIRENWAYLSTSFGIVVLDIDRRLIRETYAYIGENGNLVNVHATVIYADSIWAATSEGLKVAPLAPHFSKADFRNWKTLVRSSHLTTIAVFANRLYYGISQRGIFYYQSGKLDSISIAPTSFYGISAHQNRLWVATPSNVIQFDANHSIVRSLSHFLIVNAQQAIQDNDIVWIADAQNGLIRFQNDKYEQFLPSGPFYRKAYRLINAGNKIIATSGGISLSRDTALNAPWGFYVYENGKWTNYNAVPQQQQAFFVPELIDITDAAYDEKRNIVYFVSFRKGLITWNLSENTFAKYDSIPLQKTQNQTRTAGIAVDAQGTVWISNQVNSRFQPTLHSRNLQGEWNSFNFGNNSMYVNPRDIFIDRFNNKWIIQKPHIQIPVDSTVGVLVTRDGQTFRGLNNLNASVKAPVNAIAQDLDNVIWLGTNSGLLILRDLSRLYTNQPLETYLPRYEGLPLLKDQTITAIAVDGGNRKWVGTAEDGAWLFDKHTNMPLLHFTAQNSPLFSNYIVDIAIHPTTGEVFFATDKGIISYRSDATVASTVQEKQVRVFPNPVRPDYSGIVTITDLVRDALVKITDASGKLVWQMQAVGGTATWNLHTLSGEKATTGVYFIFSTDAQQGTETFVAKLAIIH